MWGRVGGERRELGLGVEMGVGILGGGGVDCALKREGRGESGKRRGERMWEVGSGEWR